MNIITVDNAWPVKPVFFAQYDFAGDLANCAGNYRDHKRFKDGIRLIAGDKDNRPFLYRRRENPPAIFRHVSFPILRSKRFRHKPYKASDSAPDGGNFRYPFSYSRILRASIPACVSLFIASRMAALRDNLNCFWKPHNSLKDSAGRLMANLRECVCIISPVILWLYHSIPHIARFRKGRTWRTWMSVEGRYFEKVGMEGNMKKIGICLKACALLAVFTCCPSSGRNNRE